MSEWWPAGEKVLHVEDDRDLADVVAEHLTRVGLETAWESDPGTAVERLSSAPDEFVCVVTDYRLPGVAGSELVETLSEVAPVPVVVFSAESSEEAIADLLAAGARKYVDKGGPDPFHRLREVVVSAAAERTVTRARDRYETILGGSEETFLVVSPDGLVEDAGPNLERLLGYRQSEVVGDEYATYIHPEDEELVSERVQRLLTDAGDPGRVDVRARHADGYWLTVEAWAEDFRDVPSVGGIVAYLRDVTDRVQREEWFRALIEHSEDVTSVVSPDGTIEYKGGASETVFGYDSEEIVGSDISDHVHDKDLERLRDVFEPVIEDGGVAGPETYRFQTPAGEWRWVESICSNPNTDAVEGVVVNTREVTERVERERTLQRFRAIVDSMEDAAWTIDSELRITYANDRLVERTGLSREELVGRHAVETGVGYGDEETLERYETILRDVIEGAADSRREQLTLDLPNGTHHVEILVSRVVDDGVEEAVCVSRDVTDRVESERRLKRQNERLEVLNQIVRHDIRHDMSIISGWLTLLREEVDADVEDRFEDVIRASDHVVELTRGVGEALSVIEGEGRRTLKPTPLAQTLELEVERTRDVHPDATVVVEGTVPDVEVRANEMLASVFRNAMVNAIEHAGVDDPTVRIEAERLDGRVRVRIADEGPGMPASLREALEDDSRSVAEASGTGVGLYLIEALVEDYGGQVRVEDAETGSALVVELDLIDPDS